MTELNTEQFKSLIELAEIQKQIATGRAELAVLKSALETFKSERYEATLKTVADALSASKVAIAEADKNRGEIATLLAGIKEATNELLLIKEKFVDYTSSFDKGINQTVKLLEEKTKDSNRVGEELKNQRRHLEDERRALDVVKSELSRARIVLEDRKKMLQADFERIKNTIK